jgi:hypothetical protein
MLKFRVTNVTAKDGKTGRAKFLVEAGRLLQPGECAPVNRLVQGTREDPDLFIEEGEFNSIPTAPRKQVVDDEDEDAPPIKVEPGAAQLVTAAKARKVVPLNPGVEDDAPAAAATASKSDDEPLSRDSLDDDVKPAKASEDQAPAGFSDAKPSKSSSGKGRG